MINKKFTRTAFISAELDLSKDEFKDYYIEKIALAVDSGDDLIVLGDSESDKAVQELLISLGTKNVKIYHAREKPKYNLGYFPLVGKASMSETELYREMTFNSDYDIALIKNTGSEVHKNILRRFLISDRNKNDFNIGLNLNMKLSLLMDNPHSIYFALVFYGLIMASNLMN
jgi:hypothetical protein